MQVEQRDEARRREGIAQEEIEVRFDQEDVAVSFDQEEIEVRFEPYARHS